LTFSGRKLKSSSVIVASAVLGCGRNPVKPRPPAPGRSCSRAYPKSASELLEGHSSGLEDKVRTAADLGRILREQRPVPAAFARSI
ncbi:hypothetical protein, partial [Malikia sp.]|uniref:hypothetical protein n=1 Tax=Malikia sp. TaxID=2070706 RepID=UPI00345CCCB0